MSAELQLIVTIVLPVFTFGAAYGGTKVAINGLKDKMQAVQATCIRRGDVQKNHGERLAAVETKINL